METVADTQSVIGSWRTAPSDKYSLFNAIIMNNVPTKGIS